MTCSIIYQTGTVQCMTCFLSRLHNPKLNQFYHLRLMASDFKERDPLAKKLAILGSGFTISLFHLPSRIKSPQETGAREKPIFRILERVFGKLTQFPFSTPFFLSIHFDYFILIINTQPSAPFPFAKLDNS